MTVIYLISAVSSYLLLLVKPAVQTGGEREMISNYFIGARIKVLLYSTHAEEAGWVGSKTKPQLPTAQI